MKRLLIGLSLLALASPALAVTVYHRPQWIVRCRPIRCGTCPGHVKVDSNCQFHFRGKASGLGPLCPGLFASPPLSDVPGAPHSPGTF